MACPSVTSVYLLNIHDSRDLHFYRILMCIVFKAQIIKIKLNACYLINYGTQMEFYRRFNTRVQHLQILFSYFTTLLMFVYLVAIWSVMINYTYILYVGCKRKCQPDLHCLNMSRIECHSNWKGSVTVCEPQYSANQFFFLSLKRSHLIQIIVLNSITMIIIMLNWW